MTIITKNVVRDLVSTNVIYELHLVEDKISFFRKRYGTDFISFEKRIHNTSEENFEEWDDYMEWKAYENSYHQLKKEKEDLENGNFKVTE